MAYDPDKHHRQSVRLKQYDYRQAGAYFVTICTYQRKCVFGEVINVAMQLSQSGEIVKNVWHELPFYYRNVTLDQFVVMPNHIHGIIFLDVASVLAPVGADPVLARVGASFKPAQKFNHASNASIPAGNEENQGGFETRPYIKQYALSEVVRGFKTFSARKVNEAADTKGYPLWQRSYYEHVIRNALSLAGIRTYINDNPAQWGSDTENPLQQKKQSGL
jgi:REP element-mobilizing transposase RayT